MRRKLRRSSEVSALKEGGATGREAFGTKRFQTSRPIARTKNGPPKRAVIVCTCT